MADEKDIQTHEILHLLYDHFGGDRGRYVCADEVGDVPCGANRRMDFVAIDCWASGGFDISAFEIKISKSDLRHDLEHPEKHNIFFDQIDRFSLIAPEYVLDAQYKSMLPPKWGIVAVSRGKDTDGKYCLRWKNVRKPMALVDDAQTRRTFNRAFAASIIRRVCAKVEAQANVEIAKARHDGFREGQNSGVRCNYEKLYHETREEMQWMQEFCWACGLYRSDSARAKRLTKIVSAARTIASDTDLLEHAVEQLKKYADEVFKSVKTLCTALEKEAKDPPTRPVPQEQPAGVGDTIQTEDK